MTNDDAPREPVDPGTFGEAHAGSYMTFKLADEQYALNILQVLEIIRLMEITRVPGTQSYLRGVINLRGRVVPVIDLRCRFGMPATEYTDLTVIIVVQARVQGRQLTMGVLVDEVLEVQRFTADAIQPPPEFAGAAIDIDFLQGVGMVAEAMVFLLNVDTVITLEQGHELLDLQAASDPP
jgi:purine-binding chemotaxis protein CheW